MARIDDYRAAVALAEKNLKDKNPKRIADQSGAVLEVDSQGTEILTLDFLHRKVCITWPVLVFSFKDLR